MNRKPGKRRTYTGCTIFLLHTRYRELRRIPTSNVLLHPEGTSKNLATEDEFRSEPFWSSLIKEVFWALRSLLVFVFGQPGQLKYIEWPSFQSTQNAVFTVATELNSVKA
ncbi:hypothetical protein NE237_020824 [Protea cynaroides]|uniref:Uncharacterized protein n=1 Tax=Protea cynaroides TaxID=273540 RepID=A0A9Q0H7Y7_9MAGN|nr:hypothetical protein NE237_020824 [Protea cynaroides]